MYYIIYKNEVFDVVTQYATAEAIKMNFVCDMDISVDDVIITKEVSEQ